MKNIFIDIAFVRYQIFGTFVSIVPGKPLNNAQMAGSSIFWGYHWLVFFNK